MTSIGSSSRRTKRSPELSPSCGLVSASLFGGITLMGEVSARMMGGDRDPDGDLGIAMITMNAMQTAETAAIMRRFSVRLLCHNSVILDIPCLRASIPSIPRKPDAPPDFVETKK